MLFLQNIAHSICFEMLRIFHFVHSEQTSTFEKNELKHNMELLPPKLTSTEFYSRYYIVHKSFISDFNRTVNYRCSRLKFDYFGKENHTLSLKNNNGQNSLKSPLIFNTDNHIAYNKLDNPQYTLGE